VALASVDLRLVVPCDYDFVLVGQLCKKNCEPLNLGVSTTDSKVARMNDYIAAADIQIWTVTQIVGV
jgi:hypothetical protein